MRVVTVLVQRIGQVIGVEPAIARFPSFAAIAADIDAAHADADGHTAAVARVDLDGDRAGMIAPGAEPMRIAGMMPERIDQLERIAAVIAEEEAAGVGADIEAIRFVSAARLNQPDVIGLGWHAEIGRDSIAFGILGRFDLFPSRAQIARAVQLAAPMPVIEADPDGVCARVAEGVDDRYRFKMRRFDLPVAAIAGHDEQAFARADEEFIVQVLPPSPSPFPQNEGRGTCFEILPFPMA